MPRMGLFSGSEAKRIDEPSVRRANHVWEDGGTVLVVKLSGALREDAADGWSRAIDAIEAIGWRLEQWTVNETSAWPLFRRP